MTTSGTTSDSEWQRVTTNDSKWYNEWSRVVQRVTTSHNEWQRVTTNDNEWRWMTGSGTTNENEWKQLK